MKARTNGQKLADKRRRSITARQMQHQWQAREQAEPSKPAEDPRCVVLSARCRLLGKPDTKHHRAAMTEQMAGDPAGQAIILAEPNADARKRLWDAFIKLDTAHAAYHGRIIGQRRFPKTAKIEMLPERFETDADAPMDYRSQEDREQAAINAWRAQTVLMYRLSVHDRMSLHDGLWLRGDMVTVGKITAMGQAFVAAVRSLADIAQTA